MKQYMKVTNINGDSFEFSLFDGINIVLDKENTIQTMSFNTPEGTVYSEKLSVDNYVEYYISMDDKTYICAFRGFIDSLTPSISKNQKVLNVQVLDKLSVLNRITLTYDVYMTNTLMYITTVMNLANENLKKSWGFQLDYELQGITENVIARELQPTSNVIEGFQNLKDSIPIYIYYNPVIDKVIFTVPSFLQYNQKELKAYHFDIKKNVLGTLDYGNIVNDINAVVYVGLGGAIGQALDVLSLNNTGKLRYIIRYNFTTNNKETLEELARNELLDRQKNHRISFNFPITTETLQMSVGELFTINDYNRFTGKEPFIISSIEYNISKSDIIGTIYGYAHTVTEFPERFVLQKFGVTDEDTLQVNKKVYDDFN